MAVVLPVTRLGYNFVGNVGAQNANVEARQISQQFFENNGCAIRFLAGGTGGAPDADGNACSGRASPIDELGNKFVPQLLEGRTVAEERSFVGGDGFNDFSAQLAAGV